MADLAAAARRFVTSGAYIDLTLRQLALIAEVSESGPHHVRDLARRLGVAKPIISRAIQRLCALGLIDRHRPAEDRRDCLVAITAAGRALRDRLAEAA